VTITPDGQNTVEKCRKYPESHKRGLMSDCCAASYLRFFLVRNEEAEGSNPFSSTRF